MEEKDLMFAIFGVVEYVTKSELTNTAKTLIYNYYKGSEQPTYALRARESVFRYAQCRSLPKLAEIRQKNRNQLDKLEHLVLRMEYEAARLDGAWPPATEPETPPGAVPETSSFAEALPVPESGRGTPPFGATPPQTAAAPHGSIENKKSPRSTKITPPRVLSDKPKSRKKPAPRPKKPTPKKAPSGASRSKVKKTARGSTSRPKQVRAKPRRT